MEFIHTNDSYYLVEAEHTLLRIEPADINTNYIKQKLIEHLMYINKVKGPHWLCLAVHQKTILGIACYTTYTDHVTIDFVYKICELPHIGRELVSEVMNVTKAQIVKIANLAGEIGYKCYTTAAVANGYSVEQDGMCLTFKKKRK